MGRLHRLSRSVTRAAAGARVRLAAINWIGASGENQRTSEVCCANSDGGDLPSGASDARDAWGVPTSTGTEPATRNAPDSMASAEVLLTFAGVVVGCVLLQQLSAVSAADLCGQCDVQHRLGPSAAR